MVLFPQAMKDALEEDHVVFRILEHVSLDGSKVEANASKHQAMSYGRMEQEVARLEGEILEFTAKAERVDTQEDELYGEGREAHQLREELRRREERLKRIARAKRELEDEARRGREQELRERARRLRSGAETEDDPIERKRKRTRACKNEEEADRLARGDAEPESDDGDQDEDLDLPSHRVTAHAASSKIAPSLPSSHPSAPPADLCQSLSPSDHGSL
jgi:hypothetical protein